MSPNCGLEAVHSYGQYDSCRVLPARDIGQGGPNDDLLLIGSGGFMKKAPAGLRGPRNVQSRPSTPSLIVIPAPARRAVLRALTG